MTAEAIQLRKHMIATDPELFDRWTEQPDVMEIINALAQMLTDKGQEPDCNFELQDTVSDFHDPSDSHGHGQTTGKVWVCEVCGRDKEYEKDDPEPSDL